MLCMCEACVSVCVWPTVRYGGKLGTFRECRPLSVSLCSVGVPLMWRNQNKAETAGTLCVWCLCVLFLRKRGWSGDRFFIASIFVQASWPCVKAVGRSKSCLYWRHEMRRTQTLLWSHTNTHQNATSGCEVCLPSVRKQLAQQKFLEELINNFNSRRS